MEHTIYLVFAVAGCTLVGLQVVLQVFGIMGETDMDDVHSDLDAGHADHDPGHGAEGHGNLFFGILSFKALCAFAGIFGLTGMILEGHDLSVGLQVVLQVFGIMGETDMDDVHSDLDADHDPGHGADGHGNLFFGILSFKALCAFAGIFGLTGMILEGHDLSVGLRVVLATSAGLAGMLAVARLMVGLTRLQASGTVDIRNAVGHSGVVYTRIPEANSGWGKVTVEVQGRSLELRAVTDGPELKSGTRISVVSVAGDETLKVARI